jgi:hypothetical protein
MACSWILEHQTSESKIEDLQAFLRHFSKARPLFVFIFRKSESRPRAVMTLSTKWLQPWRDFFFLYLYHVGHFNALTHLITLLIYSGHQFIHCMVLLCVQYNVELCCLFSGWFAKEANVANNKQRLANFTQQSQRRTGTLWMLRDRKWGQTCNLEGWRPRNQEHTIRPPPPAPLEPSPGGDYVGNRVAYGSSRHSFW